MGRKKPKHQSVQLKSIPKRDMGSIPQGDMGRMSFAMMAIAIVLFMITRYYILFDLRPLNWIFASSQGEIKIPMISDVPLYFQYAARAVDLHQIPYQSGFEVEYPPLAWWTIYIPRLLDERYITRPQDASQVTPIFISYTHAFRGLMFLYDLASFVIIGLIVWRRSPRLAGWAALFYTITTAILAHLLYDRLDVGLLMLLLLGAYSWTRSLAVSGRTIAWTATAYVFFGLSISYKVIPFICVPFLLLAEFHAPRRQVRLTSALLGLAVGIGLPFTIQYAASGSGVFGLFRHHAEREIQLESLYSTLMMIAAVFGEPTQVSHAYGAFNLSGNLSHAMKILSTILMFGFLAGLGIWSVYRWSRYSRQDAYRLSCYIIPTAVILSNVLSPQYFIWAFPLLLLLAVEISPQETVLPWMLGTSLVAVAAMSTWIFPYNYFCTPENPHGLVPMYPEDHMVSSPTAYIVLGLRNFTYLGVVLWLGLLLIKRIAHSPPEIK